ncbi:MAG TPA: maltose alpha-D-glucosyltransferase [Cyclobacteriaceae bacterium]|jgi:maltose alpha-D-glucosyltransferase/alpha-amylase|nr:maltose alpha-D-glucosyltransferase [Cyclobacteriaceae bacterium]
MIQSKIKNDLLWFKDTVIYELSVRSFCDGNGDGIGDFRGLITKLDYLEDLGVNTIWLLPFFPSPLKDDGFDVSEYCDVHPDYGTLADFKQFLKEAHLRGMRVITELVLNHTSDQHPWFQRSRRAKPGSRYRDYYVWSNSIEKYKEARVLLSVNHDNWAWDTGAKSYYWHRFSRHQPELNYDHPEVQLEMIKVIDFWMKLGVDGFRLASVAFLYEEEGTNCENLPQTHEFLKKIRAHIDKHYSERILMAEINQWPDDAASYFGGGQECNMCLNFSLMPRLFLALRTEDSYPVIDILEQTPTAPTNSQWALFLRNHDEIGLEMVTEEEKDYLFKAYANDPHMKHNVGIRRRLAPLLNNDRRKIELLYALLFSLPGTPIIYYGDEIGMGDNIYLGDRYGVRTPMQWNMNLNAGFSTANPQKLVLPVVTDPVYRYESVNVAMQEENPSSLMSWIKNVLAMRKRLRVFGQGDLSFIESSNSKVLSFARSLGKQKVVIVANLSQFSQMTKLDFSEFSGSRVVEAFSQNQFSTITGRGYQITLGPYGYYWLQIDATEKKEQGLVSGELSLYQSDLSWERSFSNEENVRFIERKVLPSFVRKSSWFSNNGKTFSDISVHTIIPLKTSEGMHYFLMLEVHYVQKLPERYFVPISFAPHDVVFENEEYNSQGILCRADFQGKTGFIIDSTYDRGFRDFIFQSMERKVKMKEDDGTIEFTSGIYVKLDGKKVESKIDREEGNAVVLYNDRFIFKFYRKIEQEVNPDLEVVRFLSESTSFVNVCKYAGSIEYIDNEGRITTLGLLQSRVENQGSSWDTALDSVGRFYERVMASPKKEKAPKLLDKNVIDFDESPDVVQELIGRGLYERVVRLGQRTAEMHLALASDLSTPEFAPEPFTANYQRSLHSSLRKVTRECFKLLKHSVERLDAQTQILAKEVLGQETQILERFSEVQHTTLNSNRTRVHGEFGLHQLLFTGKDFVVSDFDCEPEVSFNERKLKKSPYKDVATMMRSLHYAAFGKILLNENYREKDEEFFSKWADVWQHYVSRFYLGAYLDRMGIGKELPQGDDVLVQVYLLAKAIEELNYELNHRIHWAIIPLKGILYHLSHWVKGRKSN